MAARTGNGMSTVVQQVVERARTLAKLEGELVAYELKRKAASFGAGAGLFAAAAVFAIFGLGFAFATIAAAFATFLSTWLALLIVTAGLFVLAGVAGMMGKRMVSRATPPIPEQAIAEAKATGEALKGNGRG